MFDIGVGRFGGESARFEEMEIEDLGGDGCVLGREGATGEERVELRGDTWKGLGLIEGAMRVREGEVVVW